MLKRIMAGICAAFMMVVLAGSALAASTITRIGLSDTDIVMAPGQTYTLKATLTPSDASTSDITWSSDDTRVVSVSSSGVLTAHTYGGAIITVTSKNSGVRAYCYVGVGAPYSVMYNSYYYGYSYYPQSYYYNNGYTYPYYIGGQYYYPYGYYTGSSYPYYYYGSSSYQYYDYGYGGYYTTFDGKVVYSVTKPNPESYVSPGSAASVAEMALEVKQGTTTTCGEDSVEFSFANQSTYLTITPSTCDYSKENTLTLVGNVLNRIKKWGYERIVYSLPNIQVSLYENLNRSSGTVLTVQRVSTSNSDVKSGPWKVTVNSDEKGLSLRFKFSSKINKGNLEVGELDESTGTYSIIDRDQWKVVSQWDGDTQTYSVVVDALCGSGTYAVLSK